MRGEPSALPQRLARPPPHPSPAPLTRRPPPRQVSFDWNLESAVVFKAVAYLDHYLALNAVAALSR